MTKDIQAVNPEILQALDLSEYSGLLLPTAPNHTQMTCSFCGAPAPACFLYPKELFAHSRINTGRFELYLGHFCTQSKIVISELRQGHISQIPPVRTTTISNADFREQIAGWICPVCKINHVQQILSALRLMDIHIPEPHPKRQNPQLALHFWSIS